MKYLSLIVAGLLFLLSAPQAFAAIAVYDFSPGVFDNSGTTATFTDSIFNTSTSTNVMDVICVYWDNTSSSVTLNGVKVGSTQATLVSGATAVGTQFDSKIFLLPNPPTGTQTVTASTSGNIGAPSKQFAMRTMEYTGVNQSTTPDSSNNDFTNGTPNPYTVSTTVVGSNAWLVGCSEDNQSDITGAGSGTTLRGAVVGNLHPADSNGTVGTGSQSLNWTTNGGSAQYTGSIISLIPAAVANSTPAIIQTQYFGDW